MPSWIKHNGNFKLKEGILSFLNKKQEKKILNKKQEKKSKKQKKNFKQETRKKIEKICYYIKFQAF